MSKKAKKRTKRYHGEDAKRPNETSAPVIHRYEAVERSRFSEWWQPRKKIFRFGALATAIVAGVVWLVVELFRLIF